MHHLLRAIDNFLCSPSPLTEHYFPFQLRLVVFSKLSLSEGCNGLWLKFHSEKLSEIHVVYLMGKIIARQMKQSMTHSNQREWLGTQVSGEVRLFALRLLVITRRTYSSGSLATLSSHSSVVFLLARSLIWLSTKQLYGVCLTVVILSFLIW